MIPSMSISSSDPNQAPLLPSREASVASERLLAELRAVPGSSTLGDHLDRTGQEGWNKLRDIARRRPGLIDDEDLEVLTGRLGESPASFFALLIDLAATDDQRRDALIARFRRVMPQAAGPALSAAGYNLHERCQLLDAGWLALARDAYEADPEGAWGIVEAAAMYRGTLIDATLFDWFEVRRADRPRAYFVALLSLAAARTASRPDLMVRMLRHFTEHPGAAIQAAAFAARDQASLIEPELLAIVLHHLAEAPEQAWEFFDGACGVRPDLFSESLLDALTAQAGSGVGRMLSILRRLMEEGPRAASAMMRYVNLVRHFPQEGVKSTRYHFQGEAIRLVRSELVQGVCAGLPADAYPGYEFLRRCVDERPELIGPPEVEAALVAIPHATNYAFGFFKRLLDLRPEFTRECTLALFECLALEPVNRAFVRTEQIDTVIAIAEGARVRTGLERALREPPNVGSRRARALMAIMFRQKLRARRQVLLEALRHAATVVLWRKIPPEGRGPDGDTSEKFSPIWDFLFFIIDNADAEAVSTSAAETFLEGAFQLRYLCETIAEHEEFLRRLDLGFPAPAPFPEAVAFLRSKPHLTALHDLVVELRRRFSSPTRPGPVEEFAERADSSERERAAIEKQLASTDPAKRRRLEARLESLRRRVDWWRSPRYARAFVDAAVEASLPEDARDLLSRERKDLANQVHDALRAEAIAIAIAAVERAKVDLYRQRVREVLGREIDIERVESKVLPAFLWFQAVAGLPANSRWLKRLIEDRISGQPHDWLRAEPAPMAWAERMRSAQPGIKLERWRAPFSRQVQYRAGDAVAEKRRRIKADLAQTKELLERAGARGLASVDYEELAAALADLRLGLPQEADGDHPANGEPRPMRAADPTLIDEIAMNLERVRLTELTPDSDYEGTLLLEIESDPLEILFMGEYGFASCLSLRGINAWSAVSNAIDVDKTVAWAKEPGGNVVGRRLLALLPEGIVSFRTYSNRHGLGIDRLFDRFLVEYAEHCGTAVARGGHPRPLLSDRWYDDGAI
jgi:hypothetical protein